jgi:RimJ/RimL family protein N-acetyltransferase
VVHDVDNVAVRCPYEEPPHAPGLLRQFVFETTDASTVIASTEIHNRRWRAVMERLGMAYAREIHRPEGVHGIQNLVSFALYTCNRSCCRAVAREN